MTYDNSTVPQTSKLKATSTKKLFKPGKKGLMSKSNSSMPDFTKGKKLISEGKPMVDNSNMGTTSSGESNKVPRPDTTTPGLLHTRGIGDGGKNTEVIPGMSSRTRPIDVNKLLYSGVKNVADKFTNTSSWER